MKFRTKLTQGMALGAVLLLLGGCASSAPAPPPVQRAPAPGPSATRPPGEKDTRVIVDSALDRTLQVLKVISLTGPNGLLKIQVDVKNIGEVPRWFSYKIEWFDQNGKILPLASGSVQPWMLLAGETSSIVATAPAVTAKDFGVAFLAAAGPQ